MRRLHKEHPRLLATSNDFARLQKQAISDPRLKDWRAALRDRGEKILSEKPSVYEIPDGLRLLTTSRRVVERIQTLGLLYRLDGDKRFAERAWQELEAAAGFPDWNPRHFLDTAEMTHGFAIGYDWLYDAWTPGQRSALRVAMVEKGLKPALDSYSGKGPSHWWPQARHNWNQVCNGGIGMGALAIGDEEPRLCGDILRRALKSLPLAMKEFAPDGAWGEGPGYWDYATSYNVVFLAALDTAMGTDFGLSETRGFPKTGDFPIWMTGAAGKSFAYADCREGKIGGPHLLWLAERFRRPEWAHHEIGLAASRPQPLDLLWYDPRLAAAPAAAPALDRYFRGSEAVTMRGAWNDRDSTFVGFKAGDNKFNHSHLDIGTFSLDTAGQRWAKDLGSDNYNLPGYFGKTRWDYYRLRAEGHNTLVINPDKGPGQDTSAESKMVRFESKPLRAFAVADLTPAYSHGAGKVLRGVALLNRRDVIVQDEIDAGKPADVYWFMHTQAEIKLGDNGRSALLTQGGKHLSVKLLSPDDAGFSVMDAAPLPPSPHPGKQGENTDVRKLAVHLSVKSKTRIAVWLSPSTTAVPPEPQPLADW